MCGIVGWFTTSTVNSVDRRRFIDQALIADTVRGDDSTGVFGVPHVANHDTIGANWAKAVQDGYAFTLNKQYQELLKGGVGKYRAVIGHNRSATTGGVSLATAHPFQIGPITLVHNGTLSSTHDLPVSEYEGKLVNDSETICHNLAYHDVETVVKGLNGSFALVWHDKRDDTLNILRNGERPLHIAKDSKLPQAFIASEAPMLKWLLDRLKIKYATIYQPNPGVWMKFHKDNLFDPECKKLELWKAKPYKQSTYLGPTTDRSIVTRKTNGGWTREDRLEILEESQEPTMFLGGRPRPIPAPMQERLMDLDLEPRMRLAFCPKIGIERIWRQKKAGLRTRFMVSGFLASDDSPALDRAPCQIMGVPALIYNSYKDNIWQVNPIGVRYFSGGDPIIIAKLRRHKPEGGLKGATVVEYEERSMRRQLQKEEAIRHGSPISVDSNGTARLPSENTNVIKKNYMEMLRKAQARRGKELKESCISNPQPTGPDRREWPGPYGSTVDYHGWLVATKAGCVNCLDNIEERDADSLEWVNNGGQDPLCKHCQIAREVLDHRPPCPWGCLTHCHSPDDPDCCGAYDPRSPNRARMH